MSTVRLGCDPGEILILAPRPSGNAPLDCFSDWHQDWTGPNRNGPDGTRRNQTEPNITFLSAARCALSPSISCPVTRFTVLVSALQPNFTHMWMAWSMASCRIFVRKPRGEGFQPKRRKERVWHTTCQHRAGGARSERAASEWATRSRCLHNRRNICGRSSGTMVKARLPSPSPTARRARNARRLRSPAPTELA